jgi:hypothetical protein
MELPASSGMKPAQGGAGVRSTVPSPSDSLSTTGARPGPPTLPPPRARAQTLPPPSLEELEAADTPRPEGSFLPEQAIDEQLADLESWAAETVEMEQGETARFWLLRGTAFLSAVVAAAGGAIHIPNLSLAGGVLAALAVAIDAAWPTTTDRMARRRAIRELRELQNALKLKWDKVRLAFPDPNTPKRIAHALALLDGIHAKREEIGKYLGDAAPRVTRVLSNNK